MVNVGQFIDSFTEFMGLSITNAYTRERYYDFCSYDQVLTAVGSEGAYATGVSSLNARGTRTIPDVTLQTRTFTLPKFRALTSMALLLQQLNKR